MNWTKVALVGALVAVVGIPMFKKHFKDVSNDYGRDEHNQWKEEGGRRREQYDKTEERNRR